MDSEISRDTDPVEEKSGDRGKSILLVAGVAATGAFFGDMFYGREHALYIGNENPWAEFHYRDTGGVFDVIKEEKYELSYIYRLPGESELNGKIDIDAARLDAYKGLLRDFWDAGVRESVTPDGAIYGLGAGTGAGIGADFIRRRRGKPA